MNNKRFLFMLLCVALIGIVTISCSQQVVLHTFSNEAAETPTPAPTSTATSTHTQQPTPSLTPTSLPAATITPVPVPTDQPIDATNLFLGLLTPVENSGYAIRPVIGYKLEKMDHGYAMMSYDNLVFLYFETYDFDPLYDDLTELNEVFLQGFSSEIDFGLISSDPYPMLIDGQQATAYDISSSIYHLDGQSFVLDMDNGQMLYGFGFGVSPSYLNTWALEGKVVFSALIDTLEFIPVTSGRCEVSTDPTYGYTVENPIKISGGFTSKHIREKQYLAYLRLPYGESVSYKRIGLVEYQEIQLDEFEVTLGDSNVKLYFDFSTSGDLLAPAGFDCWGEFYVQDYAW